MSRSEFSVKTKKAAKKRAGDNCDGCGAPFDATNRPEYDHDLADGLGGDNNLNNCKVLGSKCCHDRKTHEHDKPMMDKADRLKRKHLNQTPAKKKWPSKKFDGTVKWNR